MNKLTVGKIEQLTSSGEFNFPEAKLVDVLNKDHPLVVEYVKDLKEENQQLKEKLERAANLAASQLQYEWDRKAEMEEKLETAKNIITESVGLCVIVDNGRDYAINYKEKAVKFLKQLNTTNKENHG